MKFNFFCLIPSGWESMKMALGRTRFQHCLFSLWSLVQFYHEGILAQNFQDESAPSFEEQKTAPSLPVFMTPSTPVPSHSPIQPALEEAKGIKSFHRSTPQISLNFENIPIAEFVRYVSKVAGQNFIFDEEDLQFNETIISGEPTSIDGVVTTLLQKLRIHDLLVLEQGDNLIIYRNPRIKIPGQIVSGGTDFFPPTQAEVITRIFDLNTLDPTKASELIRPLLSDGVSVEVLRDSNKLIVTDFTANIDSIAELLNNLDAPKSGTQIGHYVVRNGFADSLAEIANQVILPITQGNPFSLIPNSSTNSIYIVSNDYFVQKALAILENLDMNEGKTKVLTLEGLQAIHGTGVSREGTFVEEKLGPPGATLGVQGAPPQPLVQENIPPGQARSYPFEAGGAPGRASAQRGGISSGGSVPLGAGIEGGAPAEAKGGFPPGRIGTEGGFLASPGQGPGGPVPRSSFRYNAQPEGGITSQGYYEGMPVEEGPYGSIVSQGRLAEIEMRPEFIPGELTSAPQWLRELPTGTIESSVFYDYPVKYRKAKNLIDMLQRFAISNPDLESFRPEVVAALKSGRPLETSNSIMFYGKPSGIEKAIEAVEMFDTPIRQIFIEALFLEVDLLDSLNLGVDWATSFGGGGTNGAQAFQVPPDLLGQALNLTNSILPNALPFPGYAASVIGTHITHNGTHFSTFGAFIQAAHRNSRFHIFANPKIVTEPRVTCQVFNGTVDRYKVQSIPNDLGTLITNNYQYLEVGLMLQVTAFLNDIDDNVVIQLDSERTAPIGIPLLNPATNANDVNLEPVLTKDKTTTKFKVPNGFIVAVSGVLQDSESRNFTQIPCLGGIPIIGGLCKTKVDQTTKQNVILFIRPFIIDTEEQLEEVTKRQQDVWCEKSKWNRSWNYEIAETLDLFNTKSTDLDNVNCSGCNQ